MKLELLQENLSLALNALQRIIPNKPQLPILSTVLITASDNKIELAATDLYVGIKTSVAGKTITQGSVAVPGKIFYSSIATLDPGKITLSLSESTLTISSVNNKTTLQCLSVDEFPEFPQIKGSNFSLKPAVFSQINSLVGFSASIDLTRPVLTALLFNFSDQELQVVGTDGFRLSTLILSEKKSVEDNSFLLPAKAIAEVVKLSSLAEVEKISFQVSQKLKQALFEIGNISLYVRLIEGEYPPYKKIIPAEFTTEAVFDGAGFESFLKRAQVFARESSNIIRLKLEKNQLKVIATSPTYGQQEGVMAVEMVKGEDNEIAFNSRYLLDFMSTAKPEKIRFFMNESLTPAMMVPEKTSGYKYIIMPFRVNE